MHLHDAKTRLPMGGPDLKRPGKRARDYSLARTETGATCRTMSFSGPACLISFAHFGVRVVRKLCVLQQSGEKRTEQQRYQITDASPLNTSAALRKGARSQSRSTRCATGQAEQICPGRGFVFTTASLVA
jgi:hypothetical protein